MLTFILTIILLLCLYLAFIDFADAKDTRSAIWGITAFIIGVLILNRMLP